MKTEFTKEEVYDSYKNEILEIMGTDYGLGLVEADKLIEDSHFKDEFLNNKTNYEFVEPSKVADDIFHNKKW